MVSRGRQSGRRVHASQQWGVLDGFIAKLNRMLELPPVFDVGTYGRVIHEMTEMTAADFAQYAHSNQPVRHVLYLYKAMGVPSKCSSSVGIAPMRRRDPLMSYR